MCIHEKLSHISTYFVKAVPCICSKRVKILFSGQNSHDQMSVQSETDGTLKSDYKKYSNNKVVHSYGKESNNKERLKRPDKPLYVPRALRGVQNDKEKEDSNSTKNHFSDSSTREVEANLLTGQFNEYNDFEGTSKSDVSDELLTNKICENYLDDVKEQKQEIVTDTSTSFPLLTDIVTRDDVSSSLEKTENNQMPLKKVKHTLCSETKTECEPREYKTECERITFSNIETENFPVPVSLKLKSVLNSQQDSENNFDLKKQQSKHPDINQDAESSALKMCSKSRPKDASDMSLSKQNLKESSVLIKCKSNHEAVTHSLADSLIEGSIAPSSKCNESSNPQLKNERKSLFKDMSVETKSDSFKSTHFQLEKSADSWETKFNEDGECLDPNILKELCEVAESNHFQVTKITTDYESFADTKSRENENIVELFDFPVEFTTQDLISALSMFQKENYTIKWVDDCHALAVFTSPSLANQALIMNHPFVKVRPLSEATKESKARAKQCAKLHESSKPRPTTSATLARRLVSGALGIKNHVSKEQLDVERKLLSEAREQSRAYRLLQPSNTIG